MSPLHYWQYFAALESDLAATCRFVEVCEENMGTHSVEFARLLLSAGAEIDVLAKVLSQEHELMISPKNIDGYRTALVNRFAELPFLKVLIPRYGREMTPWREWANGKNPDWWRAYNDVKHERNVNFKKASLANALGAVSGVFVLVSYICHKELRESRATPWPSLLTLDPALNSRLRNDLRPGYVLPDFQP
jgi:hypothetical protein